MVVLDRVGGEPGSTMRGVSFHTGDSSKLVSQRSVQSHGVMSAFPSVSTSTIDVELGDVSMGRVPDGHTWSRSLSDAEREQGGGIAAIDVSSGDQVGLGYIWAASRRLLSVVFGVQGADGDGERVRSGERMRRGRDRPAFS